MDNRFVFLFSRSSERFQVNMELARFYWDSNSVDYDVVLEFEDDEAADSIVKIRCRSIGTVQKVCDRICETFLNHHGVLDLRGLVPPKDVIEE